MFLSITFLIFNWFSICKKLWKAETKGFSTIPSILYMLILSIQDKDIYCIQCYLCWHCQYKTCPHVSVHNFLNIQLIFNLQKVWKAETEGFSAIPSILYMSILSIQDKDLYCIQCYLCRHCWYKTCPHVSAHNFLNIQPIFNLQKVLESWDWVLFNHTINTIKLILSIQDKDL